MKYSFKILNNQVAFKPFDGILHFNGKVIDCQPEEAPAIAVKIQVEWAVDRAEKFIGQFFSPMSMISLLDKFYSAKSTGSLESFPKLVAIYEWANKVKSDALAGISKFDAPPYSLVELFSE